MGGVFRAVAGFSAPEAKSAWKHLPEPQPSPAPSRFRKARVCCPNRLRRSRGGLISKTLKAVSGNQAEAARRLGLGRGALIDRLKKYGFLGSPEEIRTLRFDLLSP